MRFAERLNLEHPVVQAGMGGGVAGGALAGAVSAAGGLGTVGIMGPDAFLGALHEARRLAPGRPVAANLLVPFVRSAHVAACAEARADVVVLHGGAAPALVRALHAAGLFVLDTVGTVAEARRALADGADGLVVQGLEAGGHLVGVQDTPGALAAVRAAIGDEVPVLAAGGVADAVDVQRLLDLGADAAAAGTRFLLTAESGAHPAYRDRVLGAKRTLDTLLFSTGWPMRHRVVPNAATDRWCATDERGPAWLRAVTARTGPVGRALPIAHLERFLGVQRPGLPVFTPALPLVGMDAAVVDRAALYAGESALRMTGVVSAADAVAALTP